MASNIGDRDNTQLVRASFLTEKENYVIQRLILYEIQQKPKTTNTSNIYWRVRERFSDVKDRLHLDSLKKCVLEMIETALKSVQSKDKPAVGYSAENGCEPVKGKNRKGENSKSDHLLAFEKESERNDIELKEVLLQSKLHLDEQMEFEKELKETLAKSYQEEKLKLLTMVIAEDFDFDVLADQLNKVLPDGATAAYKGKSLRDRSALILAIIELFDHDYSLINVKLIQHHIGTFQQRCLSIGSNVTYQKGLHQKNASSKFNVFYTNEYLVNIEIKGDGNCMWGSISHSLVGNYSMMESLRLLTANALMDYSEKFSQTLARQTSKFSYNALTLDQLIKASVSLQSWGDEFHLIALSLALKRPIYSYGSLIDIPVSSAMVYERFRFVYEIESLPNHFKFIGDANDANNEPILLHYDGFSHYSSVLKRYDSVKPLVPFIQIIDAVFNGTEMPQSGEPEKLVDVDSMVEVERKGYKNDYADAGRNDGIAKLTKDLREKDMLLRQYESFFQEVKKMLDNQKIDLRQLQDIVEMVESSRK